MKNIYPNTGTYINGLESMWVWDVFSKEHYYLISDYKLDDKLMDLLVKEVTSNWMISNTLFRAITLTRHKYI